MRKYYTIGKDLKVSCFDTKITADKIIRKLKDTTTPDYYLSDRELASKYDLKLSMVRKIREAADLPIKEDRIVKVVRTYPTETMFLDELVDKLNGRVSYNTLYKILRTHNIKFLRRNKMNL